VYVSDSAANWELIAKIEFAAPISSLHFSGKNNERLAVGSVDGTMAFLDPQSGYDFSGEVETSISPVTAIDCSSTNLAVGRQDGTVAVYDTADVIKDSYDSIADLERSSCVTSVTFGAGSRFLAVGDADGLIGIYSAKGDWVLCHQVHLKNSVSAVAWCPLGRHLAYTSSLGEAKVIDTIFWAEVGDIGYVAVPNPNDMETETSLSFSQDGKMLAISRSDRGFAILDSTLKWATTLNMLRENDDGTVSSETGGDQSSISSQEEYRFEETESGCYEV
jgi:WD40 repeat protein